METIKVNLRQYQLLRDGIINLVKKDITPDVQDYKRLISRGDTIRIKVDSATSKEPSMMRTVRDINTDIACGKRYLTILLLKEKEND